MGWGKNEPIRGASCDSCQSPIADGQTVCDCGRATVFMSFTERAAFEVEQYRAWKERQSA